MIRRVDGGGHDPKGLTLRCSSCHLAIHRHQLTVTGTAPDALVTTRLLEPALPARTCLTASHRSSPVQGLANAGRSSIAGAGATTQLVGPARADVMSADAAHSAPSTPAPATKLDAAIAVSQARDALVALGWKRSIAGVAVAEAQTHVGAAASLEALIREALRRCPLT